MTTSSGPDRHSYAPNGVARRVLIGLLPSERAELERRAKAEQRTLSSMARIFLVSGMQAADASQASDSGAHAHADAVEPA